MKVSSTFFSDAADAWFWSTRWSFAMLPSPYGLRPFVGIGIGFKFIFLPSSASFCRSFSAFSISASTFKS